MSARLRELIVRSYDIMGTTTPVPADCGKLCGSVCCKGEDKGMLLFPGEAQLLDSIPGFKMYRIDYMGGKYWLLICDGTCERRQRPLSCRIFPLAPLVAADGRVSAVLDNRAKPMCPLVEGDLLDMRFKRAVSNVFDLLSGEREMMELLTRISDEVSELQRFMPGF